MTKTIKYFARFLSPGSFVSNEWLVGINGIDPYSIEWPENAYAFTLHKRAEIMEEGGTLFVGNMEQIGPMYFHPDSVVESLEEVYKNPKKTETLISNMIGNGWSHIVWSRWGNWPQPFEAGKHEKL